MDYYDLGSYSRAVSTASSEAQTWFDRGLNWTFGYNHGEAVACFQKALAADPHCAMAEWGLAYAAGPNYNMPWHLMDPAGLDQALETSYDATQRALKLKQDATPVEQALIAALAARYPQREPLEDLMPWNHAFSDAMRTVYQQFPDDLEVITIFVEAILNLTPWQMWDLKSGGVADGAGTLEARAVLEQAFDEIPASWQHPGILHLYVHLMEMSPTPEVALRAGDALRDLVPDAGHLIHMPTHIDVLCGNYRDVVVYNQRASVADRKYLERDGYLNIYSAYRTHDYHFTIYGAMFLGQYQPAMDAAQELIDKTPDELLRIPSPPMADVLEGYLPMKQHVLIRFGKWQAIIDEPLPDDQALYCSTTAMQWYAKSVANSALGNIEAAEAAREAFIAAKGQVPPSRRVHNNTVVDLLAVAEAMLEGELEYRRGHHEVAYDQLRRAVELDDNLPYDEPWGWMQPARHALGALLLEQGHYEEAEAVYRADLGLDATLSRACQHPGNIWSLHGLHECLTKRGEQVESLLIRQQLDQAMARADVQVESSCYCRRNNLGRETNER